jgi:hypothetical protein
VAFFWEIVGIFSSSSSEQNLFSDYERGGITSEYLDDEKSEDYWLSLELLIILGSDVPYVEACPY